MGEFCETSRRDFLLTTSGAFVAWAYMPRTASSAPTRDPRLLVVVLRGGLDGLAAVAPFGDPDYERVRHGLIVPTEGANAGIRLDNFFTLNPNMPALARLYARKEVIIVHATASPYRQRSHFDGQDVLESGLVRPQNSATGWLNRVLSALPAGDPVSRGSGLAIGAQVPLVMRGPASVITWMPPGFPETTSSLPARLLDLYTHTDPGLARALKDGFKLRAIAGSEAELAAQMVDQARDPGNRLAKPFREAAVAAGKLMAGPRGPRVAALSYLGWDTHSNEGPVDGQLARLLAALDSAIDGLARELQPVWRETVVAVVTEFGRTARMNGTNGTDHGVATTAFLIGGALKGGRVISDWPGLAPASLYDGRDLKPTIDLRAPLKGVLADHLGLGFKTLDEVVFPHSAAVRPMPDLLVAGP